MKKVIAAVAATVFLYTPVCGVSAAEMNPDAYIKFLKESGKDSLVINVEAYKAAYGDLAAAFGDNPDAYVEHYLTIGFWEGRTKGVLFDPLAYAEAYDDVREACGNDILAIVNHYVVYGAAENRSIGTAGGYADIDEASAWNSLPRDLAGSDAVSAAIPSSANGTGTAAKPTEASDGHDDSASPVPPATNPSAGNAAGNQNYGHTTSIYDDGGSTLIRVEYYDNDNKLVEYSQVTGFDSDTNSYTEHIYNAGDNTLNRTDTYVDGSLSASEES